MATTTTEKTHLEQFQALRIEALENEILRLNEQLLTVKKTVEKSTVSDPVFLQPISELEKQY